MKLCSKSLCPSTISEQIASSTLYNSVPTMDRKVYFTLIYIIVLWIFHSFPCFSVSFLTIANGIVFPTEYQNWFGFFLRYSTIFVKLHFCRAYIMMFMELYHFYKMLQFIMFSSRSFSQFFLIDRCLLKFS